MVSLRQSNQICQTGLDEVGAIAPLVQTIKIGCKDAFVLTDASLERSAHPFLLINGKLVFNTIYLFETTPKNLFKYLIEIQSEFHNL